ncbi:MAG: adenylate/guanylate cyclase domain-containing protein [Oscillatoriales cyanobacterium RM2_1_1]|nr:adenylate/guanylate cyclase domain-containing protein [Oscillatoriales cyanobacterium RM2_1_1]
MMQSSSRKTWLKSFVRNKLQPLLQTPESQGFANYDRWCHQFMYRRLNLGLWLAITAYFTFIGNQVFDWFFHRADFKSGWLITQIAVEGLLLTALGLLQSPWGRRHPGLIFMMFSWSVTLSSQVRATLDQVSRPSIIEWPLMFFAQATLVPTHWLLHLVTQLGVLGYYLGTQVLLKLPLELPASWMTPGFLALYFFWICSISDLSVYLYDRLARAQFNSRHALETAFEQLEVAYGQVKQEQELSETLLLNILPDSIVQRLKQQPTTISESLTRAKIADSFTQAAVLFGDIVGFTELSSKMAPDELVHLLNQIFSRFDQLAEQHQLEKIKTIGDAYMMVSGLPIPRQDYAEAIADMALDMIQTLNQFNAETGQDFQMRIGIATGPVVAGVIGIKKFIYDLWGDTVNIASRMESHGIANEIQLTEVTYQKLKYKYQLECRGTINVKGKGEMTTYLLKGKK